MPDSPAERVAKHVKDKREHWCCAYNGCYEKSGERYYCLLHAERHAAAQRAQRALRASRNAALPALGDDDQTPGPEAA